MSFVRYVRRAVDSGGATLGRLADRAVDGQPMAVGSTIGRRGDNTLGSAVAQIEKSVSDA